jgi:hypothetical protein
MMRSMPTVVLTGMTGLTSCRTHVGRLIPFFWQRLMKGSLTEFVLHPNVAPLPSCREGQYNQSQESPSQEGVPFHQPPSQAKALECKVYYATLPLTSSRTSICDYVILLAAEGISHSEHQKRALFSDYDSSKCLKSIRRYFTRCLSGSA